MSDWMTRHEVAAWLRVSQPTANRVIRERLRAACIYVGRRVRVHRGRAEALLLGEDVPLAEAHKPVTKPTVYTSAGENLAWLRGAS